LPASHFLPAAVAWGDRPGKEAAVRRSVGSRKGVLSRRTLLALIALLVLVGVATSSPAAAPSFGGWSAPQNIGPAVNAARADAGPALSEDGLSLYFCSDRGGGSGGFDLWVSQRATASAAWGAPANLGPTINSPSAESVPAFSADGHWMFFASDRPGGFG